MACFLKPVFSETIEKREAWAESTYEQSVSLYSLYGWSTKCVHVGTFGKSLKEKLRALLKW